jgi:outer membrane protein assembly factor BamB
MPELRDVLEREGRSVRLDPGAFDRMLERQQRVARRRRVVAGSFGVAIAIAIVVAAVLLPRGDGGPVPADTPITPSTVRDLAPRWSGDMGAPAAPPTVVDGVVVTATADGHVAAFPEDCADPCAPAWTAQVDPLWVTDDAANPEIRWWLWTPGPPNGPITIGAFSVDHGVLFTQSRSGRVYAFDPNCGTDGATCGPLWTGQAPSGDPTGGGLPLVGGGAVYVLTEGGTAAFASTCATDGSPCEPLWRSDLLVQRVQDGQIFAMDPELGVMSELDPATGSPIWTGGPGSCCGNVGQPVRFDDAIYVNFGSELDVFPANCRGECRPTWRAPLEDAFVDGPVVVGDAVVLTAATDERTGAILAFPVDCATGGATCTTSHRTAVTAELTTNPPVVADALVAVVSTRGSYVGAFDPTCLVRRDDCDPVWSANPTRPWQPVVSDGLAFVSDSATDVAAYPAACHDVPCAPLWTDREVVPEGPVSLAGGRLYLTDRRGTVWAYAVGGSDGVADARVAETGRAWVMPALLVVLAPAIAATILVRRRRRLRGSGASNPSGG